MSAGTIPLSMTQQFDVYGEPLSGGQLYIIQVGTISTPQDAFQDFGLTIKQPYPMVMDAAGRVPQFFLADGFVKIRLTDRAGVVQLASDSVMVIGPSSGSGGGGGTPVEANALHKTGDIKPRYGTGLDPGWVRCNGRTIGSATSSATERNHEDTRVLFIHLYNIDPNLVVIGGRSGNANDDFDLGRQITLPDWRGRVPAGLDGMGNVLSTRLASIFGGNADVLGAQAGLEYHTLTVAEMPYHQHGGTTDGQNHNHHHEFPTQIISGSSAGIQGGSPFTVATATGTTGEASDDHGHTFATNFQGGSNGHNNIQPTMLLTFYIKL